MKFQEVCYVLALVACALLSQQCGGEMGSPPPADADDAGLDCAPTHSMVLPGCEVDR